ncbi:MAG: metallophosphoesterase family protein [Anaerolineae bacterium]
MTRLAILSDIHSNLPALEAVFADMAQFEIDQIVVAGDVVNWGPFSQQVMDFLADKRCAFIRGNNELYLTDWNTPRAPQHWRHFTLPPYTIVQLGPVWMNVICSWPDALTLRFRDAPSVRVVHGSPRSHFEAILPTSTDAEIMDMLAGVEETTLIAAHSHLPLDRQVDRWHVLNPGTVGNPLDGNPTASYMIVESNSSGWHGTQRRVAFDVQRVLAEFERTHFVEQCGVVGHLIVEEYRSARLEVLPFLEWWRATCPDEPQTMALLEPYSQVNKQDYMPMAYR